MQIGSFCTHLSRLKLYDFTFSSVYLWYIYLAKIGARVMLWCVLFVHLLEVGQEYFRFLTLIREKMKCIHFRMYYPRISGKPESKKMISLKRIKEYTLCFFFLTASLIHIHPRAQSVSSGEPLLRSISHVQNT